MLINPQESPIAPIEAQARAYALMMHNGQQYGKNEPYETHLKAVRDTLVYFGISEPEMLAAAWLHDTLEDTSASYSDLNRIFGFRVAELVYAVTNEVGRSRKERNSKTYPKIKAFGHAIVLKLADRIANVVHDVAEDSRWTQMYVREYPAFRVALTVPPDHPLARIMQPMWEHLDTIIENIAPTLNPGDSLGFDKSPRNLLLYS